ncbi:MULTISPECIES: DNA-primase RepB domain-containing protein [unclassified Gilliamella]|uniref:DNA-primase RepB domain-containing protein n=1 Tax=unclassified Gilliamella TaxID=2685620 RepID=UPI00132686E9|nr:MULTISPECIES: DNA-primase RepB domain-containing protein [unclassified Gilliamella]MWN32307.1 hypothetical protein [Gilliamella sp. Pra-s60]MWP29535.1 hypothetical protein [Gilliamella sp. Pra-s54]
MEYKKYKDQIDKLLASEYRITTINRANNYVNTKIYSSAKIKEFKIYNELYNLNKNGSDIYITPLSQSYYYLVIDDIKSEEMINELKIEFGKPILHLETSEKNYQFIYMVSKREANQKLANFFVKAMNKKYGDPKFAGAVHPFRLAGFRNKKEGRNDFLVKAIEEKDEDDIRFKVFNFLKIMDENEYIQNCIKNPNILLTTNNTNNNNDIEINEIKQVDRNSEEYLEISKFFNKEKNRWIGLAKKQKWCLDDSVIDFNAIKNTLNKYAEYKNICAAVLDDNKREHTEDYTIRTIKKALDKLEEEHKKENKKGFSI